MSGCEGDKPDKSESDKLEESESDKSHSSESASQTRVDGHCLSERVFSDSVVVVGYATACVRWYASACVRRHASACVRMVGCAPPCEMVAVMRTDQLG